MVIDAIASAKPIFKPTVTPASRSLTLNGLSHVAISLSSPAETHARLRCQSTQKREGGEMAVLSMVDQLS